MAPKRSLAACCLCSVAIQGESVTPSPSVRLSLPGVGMLKHGKAVVILLGRHTSPAAAEGPFPQRAGDKTRGSATLRASCHEEPAARWWVWAVSSPGETVSLTSLFTLVFSTWLLWCVLGSFARGTGARSLCGFLPGLLTSPCPPLSAGSSESSEFSEEPSSGLER